MSLFQAKNSDEIGCALHVFLHVKRNVRYLDSRSCVCMRVYARYMSTRISQEIRFLRDSLSRESCKRFGDSHLVEIRISWRFGDQHLVEIRRFAVRYLARTRIQDSLLRFRKIRYLGFRRIYTQYVALTYLDLSAIINLSGRQIG